MTCTRCARELEADSIFCRYCGAVAGAGGPGPRRLMRRSAQGRLGGVCAGIADYFDVDVTLVRLAWVILSIVPGGIVGGIVAYVAAWLVMPDAASPVAETRFTDRRLTRSVVDRRIAGVCGGIGEYSGIDSTLVRLVWVVLTIVPGAIVLGVAAYALAWLVIPEQAAVPAQSASSTA